MCSDECRIVNEKRWRKKHDVEPYVLEAKRKREMVRYYQRKLEKAKGKHEMVPYYRKKLKEAKLDQRR